MANQRDKNKPVLPFILSLIAGLWMIALSLWMWNMPHGTADSGGGWGIHGMMEHGGWMWRHGLFGLWWPWFGLLAGGVIVLCSALLYARPGTAGSLGIVIIVVSALDFLLGMGGILAGLLGIVGGALAMSWSHGNAAGASE